MNYGHIGYKKPEFYADFESVNILGRKRGKTRFFLQKMSYRAEHFFLQIGQYGYQKMQNFTLISNPKTKSRKSAPIKS